MSNHHLTTIAGAATLLVHPVHEAAEFEARLAGWQAGEPIKWAELMAAWVELPTTPVTRTLMLRLILGLIEK